MRIAIVGNFGLTGKQTMAARALPLAEALAARGHSVCAALPARLRSDRPELAERNGVQLCCVGRGPRLPGLAHIWQALLLARFCWQWRPEVLYCFKPIAYSASVLALFWMLRRVGAFHGLIVLDTDDWEGDGGWSDRQPFPGWLKKVISWQERWSLRHADLVTVASRALLTLAAECGARTVIYLPNAIAPSSAVYTAAADTGVRSRLGLDQLPVVLLYTRFAEFSVERLIDTFESILREVDQAAFLVVGRGLAGEETIMQRLAAARGMERQVVFTGWVPREQLSSYLLAADVALYPLDDTLLNRAKCPMKLLELLAVGVPVVADRVGQAAEYVDDGRTGVLVTPGDVRAMADAVVSLLRDPQRRASMGEAARQDVRQRWSWSRWAPEIEQALALAAHRPSAGARPG